MLVPGSSHPTPPCQDLRVDDKPRDPPAFLYGVPCQDSMHLHVGAPRQGSAHLSGTVRAKQELIRMAKHKRS